MAQEEFRKKRDEQEKKLREREEREVRYICYRDAYILGMTRAATDSRRVGSLRKERKGGRGTKREGQDG